MSKTIKKIGQLELQTKTYIHKEADYDDIWICLWDEKMERNYAILRFEFEEVDDEQIPYICSLNDRVCNEGVDWADLGVLIKRGFVYLDTIQSLAAHKFCTRQEAGKIVFQMIHQTKGTCENVMEGKK